MPPFSECKQLSCCCRSTGGASDLATENPNGELPVWLLPSQTSLCGTPGTLLSRIPWYGSLSGWLPILSERHPWERTGLVLDSVGELLGLSWNKWNIGDETGSPDPVSVGIPRSDLLVSYWRQWWVWEWTFTEQKLTPLPSQEAAMAFTSWASICWGFSSSRARSYACWIASETHRRKWDVKTWVSGLKWTDRWSEPAWSANSNSNAN